MDASVRATDPRPSCGSVEQMDSTGRRSSVQVYRWSIERTDSLGGLMTNSGKTFIGR